MSSEEKGQWVYLVAFVVTYGAYVVISWGSSPRPRSLTSTTSR